MPGVGGCFSSTVCMDLQVDVGDVALNGAWAQEEGVGNLAIAAPVSHESQHLDLALSQVCCPWGSMYRGVGMLGCGKACGPDRFTKNLSQIC